MGHFVLRVPLKMCSYSIETNKSISMTVLVSPRSLGMLAWLGVIYIATFSKEKLCKLIFPKVKAHSSYGDHQKLIKTAKKCTIHILILPIWLKISLYWQILIITLHTLILHVSTLEVPCLPNSFVFSLTLEHWKQSLIHSHYCLVTITYCIILMIFVLLCLCLAPRPYQYSFAQVWSDHDA